MKNTIFQEDCATTLSRLSDNNIDVVITSPPYNTQLRIRYGKYVKRSKWEQERLSKYDETCQDNLSIEDYFEWQKSVITELLRVTKKYVFYNIQMITGNKPALMMLLGHFAYNVKEIIIWDKVNSEPAISDGVLNSQYEYIIVFAKDAIAREFVDCNFRRGTVSNVFKTKKHVNKITNTNSAIFPIDLPLFIIDNFTREQDIIYDPFMGTGTTAVACKMRNRYYIGSEINPEYIDLANDRLSGTHIYEPNDYF